MARTKKETVQEPLKKAEEKKPQSSSFAFGGQKVMTKEERKAIIEQATAKQSAPAKDIMWDVKDTEFKADRWIVIVTPEGEIYQEPIPRYADYDMFIALLASTPDEFISPLKFSITTENICRTDLTIKGIKGNIITVPYEGGRAFNKYAEILKVQNKTKNVGGNIIIAGIDKAYNATEANKVASKIVDLFNNHIEEVKV